MRLRIYVWGIQVWNRGELRYQTIHIKYSTWDMRPEIWNAKLDVIYAMVHAAMWIRTPYATHNMCIIYVCWMMCDMLKYWSLLAFGKYRVSWYIHSVIVMAFSACPKEFWSIHVAHTDIHRLLLGETKLSVGICLLVGFPFGFPNLHLCFIPEHGISWHSMAWEPRTAVESSPHMSPTELRPWGESCEPSGAKAFGTQKKSRTTHLDARRRVPFWRLPKPVRTNKGRPRINAGTDDSGSVFRLLGGDVCCTLLGPTQGYQWLAALKLPVYQPVVWVCRLCSLVYQPFNNLLPICETDLNA